MHSIPQLIAVVLAVAIVSFAAEQTVGFCASEKAPVTVMTFSDFESFLCSRSAPVVAGLMTQNRDVRVIFMHAPAASNPNALLAHEASGYNSSPAICSFTKRSIT